MRNETKTIATKCPPGKTPLGKTPLGKTPLGKRPTGKRPTGEQQWLFDTELLPTSWMANGNCVDSHPSVFFPRDGLGVIAAQQICKDCPVADECLEYALTNHINHGVWGGTSERQRRRILSARRRARRALADTQTAA